MSQCGESSNSNHKSEKQSAKSRTEKVFEVRDSYYTTLLKNDQIRSVYHICVVIFILILLENISHDLVTSGKMYLGLRTIKQGFAKVHVALAVWSLMHVPIVGLYYALRIWSQVQRKIKERAALRKLWNYCCIIGFIGFQLTLLYTGTVTCLNHGFPFATASALLMETFRLLMKSYAYVRTNVPKLLTNHSEPKEKSLQLAPISSYFYYLFAPTLIYRDSYPRTARIRWTFALMNLLEVLSIIFLYAFIHERYILVHFQDFGVEKLTKGQLVEKVFAMILPSSLILLSMNYMLLHCWFNFTGEILRFGDRLFYKDWWTSANYDSYYRLWNVVVQEWFYEYIYKDTRKYICKGSKRCSSLVIFYISALIHEHVMGVALQMYYPVTFVFFGGFGVVFYLTTNKLPHTVGKVFLWFTLLLGSTFVLCLYAAELFARRNSTRFNNSGWMPVSLSWNELIGS